ncbi:hypothetical protein [Ramlibacter tataouinensis]|uniref:Uncharacterized protein n=1 Tax=Ramlibacter tataouinensis (strain ATCC BAA-407 / DSM 14655 / LMG 21543 / TTB310) TaxID=365046 RepID=F5Y354_RAMTT|nr:hypothetical protein [Ramlibacter tataouinensis]AEG94934.1 hypothetical protein Rta_38180 [Ramlibacter tataouinensis TTB310]
MSLFSWLTRSKNADAGDSMLGDGRRASSRKGERSARRELLYLVVRDAMMRAAVLSASYKFKVLSLDGRGRQFLVMVDLAHGAVDDMARLAKVESAIVQGARTRHDIAVTAVYWRAGEPAGVGTPGPRTPREPSSRPMPLDSTPPSGPVPLQADAPAPAAAAATAAAAPARKASSRFEPIAEDEVAAFKQALASGVARPAAPRQAAQNYTLLTGFEDTELGDPKLLGSSLSGTQYGDLR